MKEQQGKVGIREYVSITVLMCAVRVTEDTPQAIYRWGQNASWMIPILTGVIIFVALYLLLKTLSLYKDRNLFDVIQHLFGKYVGYIICLVLFFSCFFGISFDSRTYSDIIRSFYFPTTPTVILFGILMFVCVYGAKKGIQYIGSVSYIVIYYVLFAFFLAFLLSFQDNEIQAIFPLWGPGKLEIIKASFQSQILFVDFYIFLVVLNHVTSFKDLRKATWISFSFCVFFISFALLIYICLFDNTLQTTSFPFHTAIRFISFGSFLSNVETLFLPVWLLAAFVRFSAYLYISAFMFGYLFKVKDFEYLIPALATIFLLIGMIPEAPIDVALQFKSKIRIVIGPTLTATSLFIWLAALLKGEFRKAHKNNAI